MIFIIILSQLKSSQSVNEFTISTRPKPKLWVKPLCFVSAHSVNVLKHSASLVVHVPWAHLSTVLSIIIKLPSVIHQSSSYWYPFQINSIKSFKFQRFTRDGGTSLERYAVAWAWAWASLFRTVLSTDALVLVIVTRDAQVIAQQTIADHHALSRSVNHTNKQSSYPDENRYIAIVLDIVRGRKERKFHQEIIGWSWRGMSECLSDLWFMPSMSVLLHFVACWSTYFGLFEDFYVCPTVHFCQFVFLNTSSCDQICLSGSVVISKAVTWSEWCAKSSIWPESLPIVWHQVVEVC